MFLIDKQICFCSYLDAYVYAINTGTQYLIQKSKDGQLHKMEHFSIDFIVIPIRDPHLEFSSALQRLGEGQRNE